MTVLAWSHCAKSEEGIAPPREVRTGPTKSGMKITKSATLPSIKKKPSSVTIFGASHNGSSLTKLSHCVFATLISWGRACGGQDRRGAGVEVGAYVWFQYVFGDGRLVDGGIFVRLEVNESIFRYAFRNRSFCPAAGASVSMSCLGGELARSKWMVGSVYALLLALRAMGAVERM